MEYQTKAIGLGYHEVYGRQHPIPLEPDDRKQHVYIIGQTGTGKSTLLRNLILQDIEAGRGVGLIDPHGDLALDILNHIPVHRTDDVICFDPLSKRPLALNLFRATTNEWHMVASGIVSIFKKIWGDSWGPRLEYILYATIATLAQCENTSLLGVSRMLHDKRYRALIVRQVKDPMLRSFWVHEFERYDRRFLHEVVSPIQNKVGQLLMSPILRNCLGQVHSTINFRSIMDEQKIFIANVSKGILGETHSNLLGSLFVTAFELAALSRATRPPNERSGFFLHVDEFQNCATDSFGSLLSEARKYGLSLTLVHQYIDQLDERVSKAVFGNVGSFIAFRVGEADALTLERQFGDGYHRAHFTGLQNYEMCARLPNREPFFCKSLPAHQTGRRRRRKVMRRSRDRYGTKRKIVEERIERWLR